VSTLREMYEYTHKSVKAAEVRIQIAQMKKRKEGGDEESRPIRLVAIVTPVTQLVRVERRTSQAN